MSKDRKLMFVTRAATLALLLGAALLAGCATGLQLSPEEAEMCKAAKDAGDECIPVTMSSLIVHFEGMYRTGRQHGAALGYAQGANSCKRVD
jgi:hypothetical protein